MGTTSPAPRVPFGKRVVELGLARPDQVVAALRVQAERAAVGRHQNLGQIMVEQGILGPDQVRDILAEEFYVVLACPLCGERYNVPRDRQAAMTCPVDDSPLVPPAAEAGVGVAATLRSGAEPGSPVGREIGGCRILELLGRGGMGAVYKAKHLGLNRYVAIKLLPTASQDPLLARRLLLEARAIASLEHPNIVQVYDVGSHHGFVFMIMQLLPGRTLEAEIEELGLLDLRTALARIHDVGKGLVAAHRAGVLHRDLKPSNVIVTDDGRARLTDFGLARVGTDDELVGQVVGTPAYIAPEQWTRGAVDGRADLYSLGVIFYELVTGRRPFDGSTVQELMDQHLKTAPKAPRSINPDVSPGVQAVLSKMLAKSPARRYADVAAFLDDLALVLQDKDPKALEGTGRYLRCGFCETLNPTGSTRCKVCGEGIGAAASRALEIAVRCPHCKALNRDDAHVCATCRKKL